MYVSRITDRFSKSESLRFRSDSVTYYLYEFITREHGLVKGQDIWSLIVTDIGFPQVWASFMELIESHQRFLIASHIRPDGDAIGSALAMRRILTRLGKDAKLVLV